MDPTELPVLTSLPHLLLYPGPQLQQVLLTNPPITPAKKGGELSIALPFSFCSSSSVVLDLNAVSL